MSGAIAVSGSPLRIGGNSIWGEYFSGRIDDVRIYNRAISTAQIQSDMNTPVSQPAPDTTPPTVAIAGPAAGSTVSGTQTVTATASDSAGVSGVQFLLDGAPLGAEDTSSPYSVSWNTATAANTTHRISARARDAAGNIGVAPDVTVTVSNPPKLIITTPAQGASITGATVSVLYTTQGDLTGVDHVHFRLDSNPEVMDLTLDGTYTFDGVAHGSHVLNGYLVRADHSKIAGTDAAPTSFATVTPDTTPPTVSITAPLDGSTVSGIVTVAANAGDGVGVSGVQFLLDDSPLGAEDTSSPYSASWNSATASNAAHRLSARARDAAGNIGLAADVTVTVSNPPKLIITTPAQGASITGATVGVGYTTQGDLTGVDHVHFRLDNNPEVMDLTLDGAYAFNGVAHGSHVLTGYLVRANHSKITGTDAAPVSFTTVMPDTTPPTISLTTPAPGSSVSGVVAVAADAADDIGVAAVQFLIDGSNLGSPDTVAPYAASWQSASVTNGSHTLSAVAYDASNNQMSASVVVTVSNIDPAAQHGRWSSVMNWPLVAVHATLLHTGEVLMWDGWELPAAAAKLWNPVTNAFTSVPAQSGLFCSSHSQLADGRVLVVGGHNGGEVGIRDVNLFDPRTRLWSYPPDMSVARWYPSSTTLGDGRVLAVSGQITPGVWADTPEIYNPATNAWTRLTPISNADMHDSEYPLSFLLPDGRVSVVTANLGKVRLLDVDRLTSVDPGSEPRLLKSTVAMYRPGRLLATGGGDSSQTNNATTKASVIDFTQPSPTWRAVPSMAYPRFLHNLTVLADGSVLAVGGATELSQTSNTGTLAPELWDPATETWHTMASMRDRRNYHSVALLLPDGRVLVAGGGRLPPASDFLTAEIFSPPYLFKGPRPTISAAPTLFPQIGTVIVDTPQALDIASVALIRLGSVTHTVDMDQRYLPLQFSAETGRLLVSAPGNPSLAPPGYYMLVIVDRQGVPSTASIVRVPSPSEDSEPPSAPSNLTATGAVGRASLGWQAATDNQAVVAYNVHRSAQQGFTPSGANLVGRTGSLIFTDTGIAGTYFYKVTAEDLAGNVSAPSNNAQADIGADTESPSVTLTQPPEGSTVSGATTIAASASDDVGVTGVQFLLDGAALGTEDTTAPYSMLWSSAGAVNGTHALSARARDAAGNQSTSAPVSVTVSNTAPSGLVAAFGFNEGSGAMVVDSSGRNHTGTITNATWAAAGKFGGALQFNGQSSWVTVPDTAALDLTNGMTLEAWVNPAGLSGWRTAIMKESTGLSYALYANDNSPNPAVTVRIGTADRSAAGTSQLPLNTWTHLAATYDGAQLRLYVNGVQAGSRAQTGNMVVSTGPLRIGGNAVWTEFFSGLIDEVRVYNRALSAAEILADMNAAVQ